MIRRSILGLTGYGVMGSEPNDFFTTPLGRVYLANSFMQSIESSGDVSGAYYAFRTTVWEVIEVSPDPTRYIPVWNIIELYARADLLEFIHTGNMEALRRLKYRLNEAEQLLR
ncbi:hypothetical protein [Spirosoma litoris]